MLVLSRKPTETIVIDGDIRVTVLSIRGNQVRLGIEASERVDIYREELRGPGRDDRQCGGPPKLAAPSSLKTIPGRCLEPDSIPGREP